MDDEEEIDSPPRRGRKKGKGRRRKKEDDEDFVPDDYVPSDGENPSGQSSSEASPPLSPVSDTKPKRKYKKAPKENVAIPDGNGPGAHRMHTDDPPAPAKTDGHQVAFELRSLNPFIMCTLCRGYLRDAHTIKECLHSFCKVCLHAFFDRLDRVHQKARCPRCDIVLDGLDPIKQSLRYDRSLQDFVDKILPEVVAKEDQLKQQIYGANYRKSSSAKEIEFKLPSARPLASTPTPKKDSSTPVGGTRLNPTYIIFEVQPDNTESAEDPLPTIAKPFLRTATRLTIRQLKKFLGTKGIDVPPDKMEVLCKGEIMGNEHSLEFIKKTKWRAQSHHLTLYFRRKPDLTLA